MNVLHPAARQLTAVTPVPRFRGNPAQPLQPGAVSQAAAAPERVLATLGAHQAYAAPQIQFASRMPRFGNQQDAQFDYGDDEMRDFYLNNDPRHSPRWLAANADADRLLAAMQAKGITPEDTVFMIASPAKLLQVAARGLPNMPPDWIHGMSLYDLMQNETHGLGHIYELVLSTKPSVAYLLNTNTPLETRLVIAHVYGHTSFSRMNKLFRDTRPDEILHIVGEQRNVTRDLLGDMTIPRDPDSQRNPVKEFMNKVHSIDMLIDLGAERHPIQDFGITEYVPALHQEKAGDRKDAPPPRTLDPKDRYLYSDEEWTEMEKQLRRENTPRRKKFPTGIDRDILGFLAKHSPVLAPWQRQILQMQRERSYFFSPIMRTKIMNEGWASFWHTKLLQEDPETNLDDASELAAVNAGVIAPSRQSLNPYWLGFNIWQDLYIKAGLGLPLDEDTPPQFIHETMTSIRTKPGFDEARAIQTLAKVVENEEDFTFIEKYLTPDLCEKLKLYTIETQENPYAHYYGGPREYQYIKSKQAEEVRGAILEGLRYGGRPQLEVVDGNFEDNGELLINHSYSSDALNVAHTKKTLQILASMWGRPVHIDTYIPEEDEEDDYDPYRGRFGIPPTQPPEPKPKKEPELVAVRYTADPKTGEVRTFLREDRKATRRITVNEDGTIS